MANGIPQKFDDVSVICKANVYFEGKVISHTVLFKDGSRKTVGLIFPGSYQFNTDAPERMEITSGQCRVRLAGQDQWESYHEGSFFLVPGKSSFEIAVDSVIAEYICSFE
jgi:purine/pyrimidine-nucleoside phosphorylase